MKNFIDEQGNKNELNSNNSLQEEKMKGEKEYKEELSERIIDFPFKNTIKEIWEKNGRKVHPKLKEISKVEKEVKKPEFSYSPYENFF